MSVLVKIGIALAVLLMVASLIVPLMLPLLEGQQAPAPPAVNGAMPEPDAGAAAVAEDYEIITLLGFDAIPAILNPTFLSADEAQEWMAPNEPVVGVSINGDHRAYSIPLLSRHEIVNDTVGGEPIAITW